MAGKIGRPFAENPRTNRVEIRLNKNENERLERISKDFGMGRADAVRKLLEDYDKKGK